MRTRATELFGVEHPIVQTGMGWVSGAQLTAAPSDVLQHFDIRSRDEGASRTHQHDRLHGLVRRCPIERYPRTNAQAGSIVRGSSR